MLRLSAVTMFLFCLVSCNQTTKSTLKADGSAQTETLPPTRQDEPNPLDWISVPPAVVYDDVNSQWNNPAYLTDDDALLLRMKLWSDRLYDHLKLTYPDRFGDAIPKPDIRIMANDTINGFTSSRPVCYAVDIRFEGYGPDALPASRTDVIEINSKGSVGFYPREKVACVDRMAKLNPARHVAEYLRSNTRVKNCSISVEGDTLIVGKDCKLSVRDQHQGAGGIIIQSNTNWITLTTGALNQFPSEREAIFTLFHELGHYYLSHGALAKSQYNYFYRMNDANRLLARPREEPELQELGKKLLALPSYRTQPIEGQALHSELYSYLPTAIQNLILPACSAHGCSEVCAPIIAFASDKSLTEKLGTFPQAQLTGEALDLYFQFEKNLLSCTNEIRMTSETPVAGEISVEAVKKVFWKGDSVAGQSLSSSIQSMSALLFAQENEKNALFQQAIDQRVGYYTTEEEADNIALQWMSDLGISAHYAVDYWFRFFESVSSKQQASPYNFGLGQCRIAQENGWLEGTVPVGNYTDPHHSTCFRIFNLVQEIRVNDYKEWKEEEEKDLWAVLVAKSLDLAQVP
ncbi:MAG: hypothetical protein V4655_00145 [Bdellovibrionota bacterium]